MYYLSFIPTFLLLGAYAIALHALWRKTIPQGTSGARILAWALAVTCAPGVLGLVGVAMLEFLPMRSDMTFLGATVAIAAVAWLGARWIPAATTIETEAWENSRWTKAQKYLCTAAVAVSACMMILSILLPPLSNDPLEYATVARELYRFRDLAYYPLVTTDSMSGLYAPWTHPPLYVAIIFMGHVLQQNDSATAILRLVSPMVIMGSATLIYWLTRRIGRTAALLASNIFLATPFLFSQTIDSAIDPLVVASLLTATTAMLACSPTTTRGAIVVGLCAGLGLWSHSQAILFPALIGAALFGYWGFRIDGRLLKSVCIVTCVTLLVGVWPYVRNVFIFGHPISDNNVVFALPELDWTSYFREARGYQEIADRIQYGVLKGWFSIQMYGTSWWLMTIGCIFWWRSNRADLGNQARRMLSCALAIIAAYVFGMALTASIGTDLMIRNDRYMLVLTPYVSIIAGWGLWRLFEQIRGSQEQSA